MQYVRAPVATVCIGLAASMAAWILAAGTKGLRRALPNSRIMIHQPSSGVRGQVSDIEIHAREVIFLRKRMNEIMAQHTGQPEDKIKEDTERDRYMTAEQGMQYGIIDGVIQSRKLG
jgi:ATP-dependent Clp protease protease subunit